MYLVTFDASQLEHDKIMYVCICNYYHHKCYFHSCHNIHCRLIDFDKMQISGDVIIIGGGIGGLATALALHKNGISSQIYERDVDFNARQQGYSLTIQENGFEALKQLGISQNVRQAANDCVIYRTLTYNHLGDILFTNRKKLNTSGYFNNFAIPRQHLRQCLMNELSTHYINWNKKILRYEPMPDNERLVRVVFSDNTSSIGHALIGCDGVHSSVRQQMLKDKLHYLGVWAINGIARHHDHELFVNQTVQMIDGQSRVFVKPFSSAKSMWQFTFKVSPNDELYQQLHNHNQNELLDMVKCMLSKWYAPIRTLISNTQACDVRAGPIFDRDPLNFIDKDLACVTILGDAVHPMSPFKGQGANQALVDAVSLVKHLMKYKEATDGINNAFVEFETEMLNRTRRYVIRSRLALEFLHTEHALSTEHISRFISGKLPSASQTADKTMEDDVII
jgi:salicylate hydroxylase